MDSTSLIALEAQYAAPIYDSLPIVVESASGVWLTDVEGRRYLDCLSAYSAVNFGHGHPRILSALHEQAARVALTGRVLRNSVLPRFLERLCVFAGQEMAIPMNTGAEAVETAIKLARRWGYARRSIADGQAEIIVCAGNFHGRTTTITGFSPVPEYRAFFGPFTPGFRVVPYGDIDALRRAISSRTCAFLVEPIQGEGGIIVPPDGYLAQASRLCREKSVLFMADEIQTGLGRTGARFACGHEGVQPDVLILGKALGGGLYPVSAVLASVEIMRVLKPGEHGSTFGGNPLGAAIAMRALEVTVDEGLAERARTQGALLMARLRQLRSGLIGEIRGRGLLIGMALTVPGRAVSEALVRHGVAAKETQGTVIRITPPLVISEPEISFLVEAFEAALEECATAPTAPLGASPA